MDYEAEIQKLAAKAEPLRRLDDDDPRKDALTGIVDQINSLRAKQAGPLAGTRLSPIERDELPKEKRDMPITK